MGFGQTLQKWKNWRFASWVILRTAILLNLGGNWASFQTVTRTWTFLADVVAPQTAICARSQKLCEDLGQTKLLPYEAVRWSPEGGFYRI